MSQSIILSLRQEESSEVERNGVYTTTLDHGVLLEDGDTVNVKAVYLDTITDTIELEKDTPITMTALTYLCNGKLDQVYPYKLAADWPAYATPLLRNYFDAPNNNSASGPVFPNVTGGAAGTNGQYPLNGDNELWFMSSTHTVGGGATNWAIPKVTITPLNKTSGTKSFGGLTIHFRHKTLAPGSGYIVTPCKISATTDKNWTSVNPFPLGLQCTGTASAPDCTLVESMEYLNTWGIESVNFTEFQTLLTPGEKVVSPEYSTLQFTIPAGTYTPPEIAKEITNAVQNLQVGGGVSVDYKAAANNPIPPDVIQWPSENPFLTTILKKTQELEAINTANGSDLNLCFVNADERYGTAQYEDVPGRKNGGELYFRYDVAQMQEENNNGGANQGYPLDKFVGTNQFAMDFDEVENKLKITQCHFPLFVADSGGEENGVPGIAWNKGGTNGMALNPDPNPGTPTAQFVAASGIMPMYSGIVFTGLEPADFWNDLGFSDISVTPNFNKKMKIGGGTVGAPPVAAIGGDGGNATLPTDNNSYTLKVDIGRNTTGGLEGLDLPVQHINKYTVGGKEFFGQYSVPRKTTGTAVTNSEAEYPDIFVATNDVKSIFSSRTINTNIADEGYFLIDVESNFIQDLVGGKETTSKSTQSIVNRYYSDGAFTSDQGQGSISYTHRGEPQMLSSMKVAVRNPDRSFVNSNILLPKNSVFMEITKARPNPNA